MNKCFIIGNLTKAPELSVTPSGVSVCKFTVAVSRRFANTDGQRETDFLNCVAWRGQAETISRYLDKGSKVGIVGAVQVRSYDDKNGNKRYVTEIMVDEVEFLSATKTGGQEKTQVEMTPIDDDSLPF